MVETLFCRIGVFKAETVQVAVARFTRRTASAWIESTKRSFGPSKHAKTIGGPFYEDGHLRPLPKTRRTVSPVISTLSKPAPVEKGKKAVEPEDFV